MVPPAPYAGFKGMKNREDRQDAVNQGTFHRKKISSAPGNGGKDDQKGQKGKPNKEKGSKFFYNQPNFLYL
jgi:hypothetical protein